MKTYFTFEPGDRVITPYGAGTVDRVEEEGCFVAHDFRYSGLMTSAEFAELEDTATWYPHDRLRPEPSKA